MIDPIDLPDLSNRYSLAGGSLLSGCYYQTTPSVAITTSASLSNGLLRVSAFIVPRVATLTRLGAEVTAVGDAGSTFRLGIYASDETGFPSALAVDAGTIAGDSVGVQEKTISLKLSPGLYWAGGAVQGVTVTQPTMRVIQGPTNGPMILTSGAVPAANLGPAIGWAAFSITGALPATFPAGKNVSSAQVRTFVKVA